MTVWDENDDVKAAKAAQDAAKALAEAIAEMTHGDHDHNHGAIDPVLLSILDMSGDGSPPVKPNRGNGH